jgi:purine-binding chemotaxis protein CheW
MPTLPPLATRAYRGSSQRDLRLVAFKLGRATYGIDVEDVFAIYHALPLVPSPDETSPVAGYLHLSDGNIPVVDLRVQAKLPQRQRNHQVDWIIAIRSGGESVGLIVDDVTEVLKLEASALQVSRPQTNGNGLAVQAIVTTGTEAVIIPDLTPILRTASNR